ncbi:MAG: hypothetical protein JXR95_11830 [Deltaproteobacteria bacterium]|nr:hypothetical protein [Deltaproteobacteria bacterium]
MNRINLTFIVSLFFLTLIGCDDSSDRKVFSDPYFTSSINFSGVGRIFYTITGPTWDDPNSSPDEILFELGNGYIDSEGYLNGEYNELAAYCSGAAPWLVFHVGTSAEFVDLDYSYKGTLYSADGETMELFDVSGTVTPDGTSYPEIFAEAQVLPMDTAKFYILEIQHNLSDGNTTYSQTTRHEFAQVWRCPLAGTPLYKKIIIWGSEWINGHYPDTGEDTENILAEKLLLGMKNLEPLGYRYGAFPRPSEYNDRAEIFLDFKQSACGEFRGFYMALTETQGIDSNWLWFWFRYPSSEEYSMYQTIDIPALGTDSRVWRYSDHIVVQVNDKVYDPTYLVMADTPDEYEDYMFDSFCYGEDTPCAHAGDWCTVEDGPQGICTENHEGYVEGESPLRFTGEDYR